MEQIEVKNGKFVISGKEYTPAEVARAVRFWRDFRWHKWSSECPICGTDLESVGLFVCKCCGELLPTEERCPSKPTENICCECCEHCQADRAFSDEINRKIDAMCGK